MYIIGARLEDRGLYLCEVENSAGRTFASVVIEVESKFPCSVYMSQFLFIFKGLLIYKWIFLNTCLLKSNIFFVLTSAA